MSTNQIILPQTGQVREQKHHGMYYGTKTLSDTEYILTRKWYFSC